MNITVGDHLLTTTRGVRRRLDFKRPVEPEVIGKCIELALQAPVGSLAQKRHFIVITDPKKRRAISDLYGRACYPYLEARQKLADEYGEADPRGTLITHNLAIARFQADHLHEVPVLIILAIEGRVEGQGVMEQASLYGSILPAAWSLMLALRSRGLGSCWTTLHLQYEREAAKVLGIPDNVTQAVLLPVAYFTGADFKPAARLPMAEQVHWDSWGNHRRRTT